MTSGGYPGGYTFIPDPLVRLQLRVVWLYLWRFIRDRVPWDLPGISFHLFRSRNSFLPRQVFNSENQQGGELQIKKKKKLLKNKHHKIIRIVVESINRINKSLYRIYILDILGGSILK